MKLLQKLVALFRDFVWRATRHWLSAIGVLLTSMSAISFLTVFALELSGQDVGHYVGLISYLILPAVFVLGLSLMPVGLYLLRKRERAGIATTYPVFNFNDAHLRSMALVVGGLTVVNLMVVATGTFKGLDVMHGDEFCGGSCHTVMQPEAVAHAVTPHAKVYCVDCHIGEGAQPFVHSKLRGVTQLVQFITGDVKRPAPQPTVVPQSICVRCHDPQRYIDDRLHIRRMYSDEETAKETLTVYRMIVGGKRDGQWTGAHKHNGMQVRYLADPKRETISEVEVTRPDGTSDKFVSKEVKTPDGAQWFDMSCTDCHNRPAHRFSTPEAVVEQALGRGAIDPSLPFIVRESVSALKGTYASHEAAQTAIPQALSAFYAKQSPELDAAGKAKVDAAGKVLAEAWTHNNFPDMKVGWGTYADYFSHEPGCYRCHDKKHENAKGEVIAQRCSGACHEVIATEEEQPEVMDVLYP